MTGLDVFSSVPQHSTLLKLSVFFCGVYIWELVTSFNFDLCLLKTLRSRRPAAWVYFACRYFTFVLAIVLLASSAVRHKLNCQVWQKCVYALWLLAIWLTSALIGIRTIAIWDGDRKILVVSVISLLFQFGSSIFDLVEVQGTYDAAQKFCVGGIRSLALQINSATIVLCDSLLLILMLVGLRRYRISGGGHLWKFLWLQGLLWTALAVTTEIAATIFLFLRSGKPVNIIALCPGLFTLVVSATRMYRMLRRADWYDEDRTAQVSESIELSTRLPSGSRSDHLL